jgi:hypothetical protein
MNHRFGGQFISNDGLRTSMTRMKEHPKYV